MKKVFVLSVVSAMLLCLTSCGSSAAGSADADVRQEAEAADQSSQAAEFDIDLTQMSSTMVYSQVSDMVNNPENYMGKTVRAKGPFSYYLNPTTNNEYYAVMISDATACCAQGIEFLRGGDYKYPDDYPALETEIIVTGNFNYYKENGYTYCQLTDAVIEPVTA